MQPEQLIMEQEPLGEGNCWQHRAVVTLFYLFMGFIAVDSTQESMEQSCNLGNRLRSRRCSNCLDVLFHPRAVDMPGGEGKGLAGPHQAACQCPWVSQTATPHLCRDAEGDQPTQNKQTKHSS